MPFNHAGWEVFIYEKGHPKAAFSKIRSGDLASQRSNHHSFDGMQAVFGFIKYN